MEDLICAIRSRRPRFATIGLILTVSFNPQPAAEASTYVVDRFDDPFVVNIFEGCNLAANDCSLRTAIRRANANTGVVDTVAIPPGTYTLSLPGVDEDAALWGDLDITEAVTITSLSSGNASNTIIDGGGIDRVFHILSGNTGVVNISGVTIRNGLAEDGIGGGIYAFQANLTLVGVNVTGNSANTGGGINCNSGSTLSIQNGSKIFDNVAMKFGGGLAVGRSSLEMSDSTISDNQADGYGGGLYVIEILGSSVKVERSTISGNTAKWGGGIGIGGTLDTVVEFVNSSVSYNSASENGGGVRLNERASASFHSTTMIGNSAPEASLIYADSEDGIDSITYLTNNVMVGSCGGAGDIFTMGGNVVSPEYTCQITGGDSIVPDVMLTSLGFFGGPTMSHLPLVGSPVIGAGADCATIGEDQRGRTRPVGECDAGSVERQPDDPEPTFVDGFESGDTSHWD